MSRCHAKIDWDAWRRRYPWMSHQDQVDFYEEVWAAHPVQRHYDLKAALAAIPDEPLHIVELGGWTGQLAAEVLAVRPKLRSWKNIEICKSALEALGHCSDYRYVGYHTGCPIWEVPLDCIDPGLSLIHI